MSQSLPQISRKGRHHHRGPRIIPSWEKEGFAPLNKGSDTHFTTTNDVQYLRTTMFVPKPKTPPLKNVSTIEFGNDPGFVSYITTKDVHFRGKPKQEKSVDTRLVAQKMGSSQINMGTSEPVWLTSKNTDFTVPGEEPSTLDRKKRPTNTKPATYNIITGGAPLITSGYERYSEDATVHRKKKMDLYWEKPMNFPYNPCTNEVEHAQVARDVVNSIFSGGRASALSNYSHELSRDDRDPHHRSRSSLSHVKDRKHGRRARSHSPAKQPKENDASGENAPKRVANQDWNPRSMRYPIGIIPM